MPAKANGLTVDQHTIAEHRLKTKEGEHKLYVQEWGNKSGTPILFLHGGPGSGCNDGNKLLFDPKRHYVVFHDQRGSGQSNPYATMVRNTTQNLVEDIEQIADNLKIKSFVLFGRSWGSTLALCYTIKYPTRVTAIVTGGVFLGTKRELDWIEKGEFRTFFPEVWQKYGEGKLDVFRYAQASVATLRLDDRYPSLDPNDFDNEAWIVERGYADKDCFLADNYILDNASKVTVPVTIIQGRYDMLTTPVWAYKLYEALPNSTLQWTIAGHSSSDRANFDASKATLSQL